MQATVVARYCRRRTMYARWKACNASGLLRHSDNWWDGSSVATHGSPRQRCGTQLHLLNAYRASRRTEVASRGQQVRLGEPGATRPRSRWDCKQHLRAELARRKSRRVGVKSFLLPFRTFWIRLQTIFLAASQPLTGSTAALAGTCGLGWQVTMASPNAKCTTRRPTVPPAEHCSPTPARHPPSSSGHDEVQSG